MTFDDRRKAVRFYLAEGRLPTKDENSAPPPTLTGMALSLAKAVVEHAKDGLGHASEEEQERRVAICRSCPHYNPDEHRCGACGCHLGVKLRWRTSTCPKDRWEITAEDTPK